MASKGSGVRIVVYDEHDKIHASIRDAMIETIESFYHLPSCISFIEQNAKDDRVNIVITTSIEDHVLQSFERLHPVEAILISSKSRRYADTLLSKVIGVYPKMENLLVALFETMETLELQLNANSILFHRQTDGSYNTDFYFYAIWKTHYRSQMVPKKSLVEQSRYLFYSEKKVKAHIQDFNANYQASEVLYWLDKYSHPFPYNLLVSNALRTHDQQILSVIRLFILDLNKQMKPLPIGPSYNQVFFGTKLSIELVDRLEQLTSKDIIAFQCFLPVMKSRTKALAAATQPTRRRKIANVLFKIDASNALCAPMGETVLIDMATPFHITCVTRNTGSGGVQQLVTIVTLVAIPKRHRDYLFSHFIEQQRKAGKTISDFLQQTIPLVRPDNTYRRDDEDKSEISQYSIPLYVVSVAQASRDSLAVCNDEAEADELIARGNWAQAVDALARIEDPNVRVLNKHGCLLRERLQDLPGALECHEQALGKATDKGKAETLIYLGIVYHDMKQYAEALNQYSQALQWFDKQKSRDPNMIARCLVGLGNGYWARRELDEARDCTERALAIREHEVEPKNYADIASCLGNLGNILHDQGHVERALDYAKQAADLLTIHGTNDLRLAASLNNLGAMYLACGQNDKARENFERAIELIKDENHPYRQSALNNIVRLDEMEAAQKE
ncbi:unnamed protein product [Rotaria socialis]|uniref:Uncharacterized protein n=1 Tax=Rotaria socialis TaxID=392032 RepID=A0A820IJI5_9BILA|nr:unnamed protein product [Rotaria socialis]CAF3499817.1 unnamed protein product [Rotaria socialis]CAF3637964.1 unnamed protein product [Rotaria socialis]CAF4219374.1 unnamed protein product [Rotaria socialis]CAF4311199.1 unnamed protein product [Rotaria socialis]